MSTQVPGTPQTISFRNLLFIADGVGRIQRSVNFFLSTDCSGSLYAAYQSPARGSQYVGQRASNLPDTGQTVMGTLHLVQSVSAPLQIFGAVMQLPNNAAMVGIVVDGVQTLPAQMDASTDVERFFVYATRSGLYMTSNRDSGAVLDSQGFPTRFNRGIELTRVQ